MVSTSQAQHTGSVPSLEATMLQPNHQLAYEKLTAAILGSTQAPAAILSGDTSGLTSLAPENKKAQQEFLIRVAATELRSALLSPHNAALVAKIEHVREAADSLLRDTPRIKAQQEKDIAKANTSVDALQRAVTKEIGKNFPGTAEVLASATQKFIADIRAKVAPPNVLETRQAELALAHRDLQRAMVVAAADDNNPRLRDAFVAFVRAKIEGFVPTTPREIANFLDYCVFKSEEPPIGAIDRAKAHKEFTSKKLGEHITAITSVLAEKAVATPEKASTQFSARALQELPVGAPCLIGRHPQCDMVVTNNPSASGFHLLIEKIGTSTWAIYDNSSSYGTIVDGNTIPKKTRLEYNSGAELEIGIECVTLP